MIILGIDPGIATTGYGLVEKVGNTLKYITHGVITTPKEPPLSKRILSLYNDLESLIKTHNPKTLAVEELFFSKNTKTAMMVAQARGVVLLAGEQYTLPVSGYTPLQVKSSVCGFGKAEKSRFNIWYKIIKPR